MFNPQRAREGGAEGVFDSCNDLLMANLASQLVQLVRQPKQEVILCQQ